MKSTELRIGNYVKSIGIEYVVWKIDALGNVQGVEGGTAFNLDKTAEPIPLTEEWLVKFGFEKWGRDDMPRTISYQFSCWSIFPPNNYCDFQEGFGFMWYKPIENESTESARVVIKHVHQLQNLYFALTGEELTIKNEDR